MWFRDDAELAQTVRHPVDDVICASVAQSIVYMRMFRLIVCDPFCQKSRSVPFHGSDIERSLKAFGHFRDMFPGFFDKIHDPEGVL